MYFNIIKGKIQQFVLGHMIGDAFTDSIMPTQAPYLTPFYP